MTILLHAFIKIKKFLMKKKKIILSMLLRGRKPSSSDKQKLDNTLSKYNVYLQKLANLIVDDGLYN